MRFHPLTLGGTLLLASIATAQTALAAPIHGYSVDSLPTSGKGINSGGGHLTSIDATYDAGAERFSWRYTVSNDSDGFWLVVSDGEDPKNNINEYAILYGDLVNDRITAYVYDGDNDSKGYENGLLLGAFDDVFTIAPGVPGSGSKSVGFTLDVAGINTLTPAIPTPADWDGVAFGEHVGIWFHLTRGTNFGYDANDEHILSYGRTGAGYFDRANLETVEVPEPTALSLLGLGAFALVGARRRRGTASLRG